jgi:hypothetical protein
VPANYLVGLKTVVLANQAAVTRDERRRKVWSRNRKVRLAGTRGAYSYATNSSPATIWLYVDNICRSEPAWWRKIPVLRYMVPSDVLYHEIGHHIQATHRPVHDEREDVADDWRRKLWANFLRKRYWYLFPLLYMCGCLLYPVLRSWRRPAKRGAHTDHQ